MQTVERPVSRQLLATFIEYAARGCVTPIEWQRFMVAHYADPWMEEARRECVRVLQGADRTVMSEQRDSLLSLADRLRSAIWQKAAFSTRTAYLCCLKSA